MTSHHQYNSTWPKHGSFPGQEAFASFFESFYAISDTPDVDEQWVDQFTPEATVIMASKTAKGKDALLALRKGMWAAIASRRHTPEQVFVFSGDMDRAEVMLHGTVAYTFRAGGEGQMPWSGRARLVRDAEGKVRMEFYQVYLDTAAQKPSS